MAGFVTVHVKQGALRGRRCRSPNGTAFLSFQGVPYAEPPLGQLRFQAPQPPQPWTGIRDATKLGNQSLHFDLFTQQLVGAEDCLFLNVFAPSDGHGQGARRPVMVWIHGGAFVAGSSDMYGPEPLVDEGVVLVTINYRLGPLGFLSLGTAAAPGNAGLKDQVMALRWVKENISAFGGDAANVTIFGESAGGASVHYLMLSPLAEGLFRRAVVQSGSVLCPWAFTADAPGRARRLAAAAGYSGAEGDDAEVLAWLRTAPPEALVAAQNKCFTTQERRAGVLALMVPCAEPPHAGAFITQPPAAILAASPPVPGLRIPVVFGLTTHEGILALPQVLVKIHPAAKEGDESDEAAAARMLAEMASDLERVLPPAPTRDLQRGRRRAERVKDFYLQGKQLGPDTLPGYVDLMTDVMFSRGVLESARAHARAGAPVFLYEFAYASPFNMMGQFLKAGGVTGAPMSKGVCHADELAYLFGLSAKGLQAFPDADAPADALTRRRLCRLWASFAANGDPTPEGGRDAALVDTAWKPYTEAQPHFLRIGAALQAEQGLWAERMRFWTELDRE